MKNIYSKAAFTLIELVVSIVISTVVLVIVFGFTGETIANLVDVNRKSDSLQEVYRFTTILSSHKGKYIIPEVLVDNAAGLGHDIFYMKDTASKGGILWAVVDHETLKIEEDDKYSYYGDKVLGYRLLSESEIIDIMDEPDITADSSVIYNYTFFEDKLFYASKIKEFQLELYNSGALIEANIEILPHYKKDLDDIEWDDIPKDDVIQLNINI